MTALSKFTEFVGLNTNLNSWVVELYERLTDDESYTVFKTTYEVREWLLEQQREACDAQWNNVMKLTREFIQKLDEFDISQKLVSDAISELRTIVSCLDLSDVVDHETALAKLKAVLNNM